MNNYKLRLACVAIYLGCLVPVASMNYVAREEYYFSTPSKKDNLRHLPALSSIFLRYCHYSWVAMLGAFVWCVLLIGRKQLKSEDVLLFAAAMCLVTMLITFSGLVALYLCNQSLVFNFQHLR